MQHLITLSLLLFLFSCSEKKVNEQESPALKENQVTLTDIQLKNAGIKTALAENKAVSSLLTVNGKIDVPPQNMVSVSVPLGGYLKTTQLLPGMKIKKGEVIATLEDPQYVELQQSYLTALAKLSYSEKEYARQKELNQSKASSDKVFQQSESDFRSEKIMVKALYEKLKLIGINPDNLNETTLSRSVNIYAPIDGYVSSVNVNIGKYVNPSDVLFELVNPTDIHLALTVFEKDLNKLYIGQKLKAYSNHQPDKKYNCEIILIGQNLSVNRSVEVHCHFEEYDKTLLPGMYMNAEINVKTNITSVVPEDAVVSFENKQYVFLEIGNNEFKMQEIKTGTTEAGFIELISPEANTKKIVVKGAYTLLMMFKNKSEE